MNTNLVEVIFQVLDSQSKPLTRARRTPTRTEAREFLRELVSQVHSQGGAEIIADLLGLDSLKRSDLSLDDIMSELEEVKCPITVYGVALAGAMFLKQGYLKCLTH